jgi:hypothetical protein
MAEGSARISTNGALRVLGVARNGCRQLGSCDCCCGCCCLGYPLHMGSQLHCTGCCETAPMHNRCCYNRVHTELHNTSGIVHNTSGIVLCSCSNCVHICSCCDYVKHCSGHCSHQAPFCVKACCPTVCNEFKSNVHIHKPWCPRVTHKNV